ncbi:hypothetical protein V8C37DRAFT_383830 [Trichoderma ceciliae]
MREIGKRRKCELLIILKSNGRLVFFFLPPVLLIYLLLCRFLSFCLGVLCSFSRVVTVNFLVSLSIGSFFSLNRKLFSSFM